MITDESAAISPRRVSFQTRAGTFRALADQEVEELIGQCFGDVLRTN